MKKTINLKLLKKPNNIHPKIYPMKKRQKSIILKILQKKKAQIIILTTPQKLKPTLMETSQKKPKLKWILEVMKLQNLAMAVWQTSYSKKPEN